MVRTIIKLFFFNPFFLFSQGMSDIESALKVHNDARTSLGIPTLKWSSQLANEARLYAKNLADTDYGLRHSNDSASGENLYMICCNDIDSEIKFSFKNASESWYDEINDYEYGPIKSHDSKMIGHYTQMIWSKTKLVGIGYAVSSNGAVYVVARYFPAGNYVGEYPY